MDRKWDRPNHHCGCSVLENKPQDTLNVTENKMYILILSTSVLLLKCTALITLIKFSQSVQCINPLKASLQRHAF